MRTWAAVVVLAFCSSVYTASRSLAVPDGWVKEVISSSPKMYSPREVRATVLDGKPTVFFFDWQPHGNTVKQAQRQADGTWSVATIVTSTPGVTPYSMDYALIGGKPWLALGGSGQVQMLSCEGGTWTSQYLNSGGLSTYGDGVSLADHGGEPVAVYPGADPYDRIANFLERSGGTWTETSLGTLGYTVTGLDIGSFGGNVGVTLSYSSSGTYYSERNGSTWSSSLVASQLPGHAVLADSNGQPSFFVADRRSSYAASPSCVYSRDGGAWSSTIVNSLSYPVGQDYKVLNGIPVVAYYERGTDNVSDLFLHLATFNGATWDDLVLDAGNTSFDRDVSLTTFNGHPAVAVFDNATWQIDYYYMVPEPATLSFLALGSLLLARRRRA